MKNFQFAQNLRWDGKSCDLETDWGQQVPVFIGLQGALTIRAPDGGDLTPAGSRKILGLIALLATGPNLRRSRKEVQALLWSDRSPDQQSASLRQALSELRRALGPWADAVQSDRQSLALNPDKVIIQSDGPNSFLDGLDIPDPAFDTWLRLQRRQRRPTPALSLGAPDDYDTPMRRPQVFILREPGQEQNAAMVSSLFSDILSRSLSEQFTVDISETSARSIAKHGPGDYVFIAEAMIEPGFTAFRIALEAGPMRRRLWFGHQRAEGPLGEDTLDRDNLQRLVNEAVEGYAEVVLNDREVVRERLNASVLGRTAVRQVFTMRPDLYAGADDLLDRAFCLDPRGIYLAWRVLLRIVQLVERHEVDTAAVAAEAQSLARRAVEFEPLNSVVLAAASNVASLIDNAPHAALELAQRAVRLNRANPFGWDCLSTAALHAGKLEEAHVFAVKAQKLAGDTPFKHWYDMGRALTATVTGRFDEALSLAGAASVMPHFKPPLRYIAALHAHAGQPEAARAAIARLTTLEPDFHLDMMERDPAYPVAALRRSQILRKGLFGNLG